MIEYILGTIFISGILGGLINSFLYDSSIDRPLLWWQHILIGIGAAFIVPMFLSSISSGLISEINDGETTSVTLSKLLTLAGFCLLAAISSRAFIRSMIDRLMRDVAVAKEEAKEAILRATSAEEIADLTIEPESLPSPTIRGLTEDATPSIEINEIEKKILQVMIESRFSMRSISGIAKDASLSPQDVNSALGGMLKKSLVEEGKNKEGQIRWHPTAYGRQVMHDSYA